MSKVKVLHVQLLPLMSGVQRVSYNEITQLKGELNVEFQLLCSEEGPLTKELDDMNVKTHVIDNLKRNISPLNDMLSLFAFFKFFREHDFDVVHTHSSKTGFLGRIGAKLSGVKNVIHTVHGFAFPSTKNRLLKLIYFVMEYVASKFTDSLIVLNESDYDIAVNKIGFNSTKVHIIANGIDTQKFCPIKHEEISYDPVRIVMVGRLWKQKNPMCLAKAIKQLVEKGIDVKVDYIGDGELKKVLEDYIACNDLSRNVNILGWQDDVHTKLPLYDIFVLPSLWEGMPLAILEAQACGLPCIVSDIPGNRDLVNNNVNGYLFTKNDSADLASKIEMLINDDSRRSLFSINAREQVLLNYSSEVRNKKVLDLYFNN